jgi:hypothetical protein
MKISLRSGGIPAEIHENLWEFAAAFLAPLLYY